MGGGGQSSQQSTQSTNVTQLPPWVNQAAQQNYALAQQISQRPLQQYQGQMVPGVTPQLQQAWDVAAGGLGAGQSAINAGQAGYLGALGQAPGTVDPGSLAALGGSTTFSGGPLNRTASGGLAPYMNPYTNAVLGSALPLMQQQLGQAQSGIGANATNAYAFGGSRQGVQEGVTQAQGALNMAQLAAQLQQQNYGQAVGQAQQDIATRAAAQGANVNAALQKNMQDIYASQGLVGAGQAQNQTTLGNYGLLAGAGASEQAQAQQEINANIAKFQNAWQYPNSQLGVLQSALGMTPYGQASVGTQGTTTTQQSSQSPGMMALGGLEAIAPLFSAGGIFGGGSDRRMKTDITPLGRDKRTGLRMHAFRYKGDPKSYPKTVGPMAQDVQKKFPGMVAPVGSKGMLTVKGLGQPPPGMRGGGINAAKLLQRANAPRGLGVLSRGY